MHIPLGFKRALAAKDLALGTLAQVKVGGRELVLANIEGTYHAMEGHCPHAGAPLGDGRLRGSSVVCSLHFWAIDFATGGCSRAPGLVLDRFETKLINDHIYIKI